VSQTTQTILLRGGLDLVTPQIAMPGGRVISCQNYEPDVAGYTSTGGYQRTDGRAPGDVSFWYLAFDGASAGFTEGQTILGATSHASGVMLADAVVESGGYAGGNAAGYLLLGSVSGTFQDNEALTADLNDSYTKVYLDMNGVDAATTFTDTNGSASAHTWTAAGNAQIDTADFAFGGASGLFDGTGDYITTPDSADFVLGTSDFSIDCLFKIAGGNGGIIMLAGQCDAGVTAAGTSFWISREATGEISCHVSNGAGFVNVTTVTQYTTASNPGWHHLEFTRNGNLFSVYIDGVLRASATSAITIPNSASVLGVGCAGALTSLTWFGWIDKFSLSVGVARHTAAFTLANGAASLNSGSTDAITDAGRRAAIRKVPGTGPVRGDQVYAGALWAFRDQADGSAAMFKATAGGWVQQTFGYTLDFNLGITAFLEGETVTGASSGATGVVQRVTLSSAAGWTGTAAGFLVLSGVTGTFTAAETITSTSGSAKAVAAQVAVALSPGGVYEFVTHNFYGAAKASRLYFVNGVSTGFEWDGTVLAPLRTGIDTGSTFGYLLTPGGPPDRVLTPGGDRIIVNSTAVDNPAYIGEFRNHLFLGYAVGAIVFSGPGVPLDYRTIAGAGTFAFGDAMTGIVVAATALVILGRGLIEYVAGNNVDDFQKLTVTDSAGAVLRSPKVFGESPLYLDDGGLRKLSSSAAYGDFKTGTVTQLLEPLFRQKRLAGIVPNTALVVTGKDQYRLYWNDGSGVVLYMGRKYPETLPFKLPATFFSSCVGELDPGMGDRLFAGGTDGYVYELDRGTSFDGALIDAYLRLAFDNLGSPTQNKVFHKYTGDVLCADPITVGVKFDIDYARGLAGAQSSEAASAGQPIISTDAYASINWAQPVQGELTHYLYGFGRNIAVTLVTSSSTARQHTFPASTINFSPRGLVR
jgi:hypothetical protein